MSDKLVFDLASEVEGSPNVFIRKDWINILDNQNQNYNNNQSVIDTSQLSNSNKYMSYREAYFLVPLLLTVGLTSQTTTLPAGIGVGAGQMAPSYLTPASNVAPNPAPLVVGVTNPNLSSFDQSIGLKNWFGQIIHSFTLDYNGTTIIQQTPYSNMWNTFKLMTSLSYNDLLTQGPTIGFYPDDPTSFLFLPAVAGPASLDGSGTCNNSTILNGSYGDNPQCFFGFSSGQQNEGLTSRMRSILFNSSASIGSQSVQPGIATAAGNNPATYATLVGAPTVVGGAVQYCNNLWKSYISSRRDQSGYTNLTAPYLQISVVATIYLKHVHSFFNMCPLLKGVFMKMTLNLNNCSTVVAYNSTTAATAAGANGLVTPVDAVCTSVQNSVNGVNPILIPTAKPNLTPGQAFALATYNDSGNGASLSLVSPQVGAGNGGIAASTLTNTYTYNISVGSICLNQSLRACAVGEGQLAKSIYLYIPSYTFNPVFEQSYLSSPIKQIKYTDIYQYQVLNVAGNNQFNNLLTNGIANIKSVLIIPFYNSAAGGSVQQGSVGPIPYNTNSGFLNGIPVFQSPYDPAGCGATSPLIAFSNMNVQISGQNAIYNVQKYSFEEWNNQLYGQNAVNGGMTDGLTSGLIDRIGFDMEYCFYYVNVERMLPVEQSVPKSVQILGTNNSIKAIDLYCFIEYGVDISIDALTGARV